jgi:8-oxo-dGTP pyrophosphatase MutT (NUDIX family)
MYVKIYFNDKPLFLTDKIDSEIEPYAHHDDAVLMDDFSSPGVNSIIHEMRQEKIHAGIFIHPDLKALQKAVWKKFTIIKAGGGVVLNDKNELLVIHRRGKWDLPKGKLDPGEKIEACALRETEEETGLKNITLKKLLCTTYHTYDESGKHILKESYWYLMSAPNQKDLSPQTTEDISVAKWIALENLEEIIANTYPSIKDVLGELQKQLP